MKIKIPAFVGKLYRIRWATVGYIAIAGFVGLSMATYVQMAPLPTSLDPDPSGLRKIQVHDRSGLPLTITYYNDWNYHDLVQLHEVPRLLKEAFIKSEDKRFWNHSGVDWTARIHAVWQNLKAGRIVRGASTITEQVVRMITPRSRTLWSRWLEGWEAYRLDAQFEKGEILNFYLNQVPYDENRRGVVQAARNYFGRDIDTLNEIEMLALVVAVRAPSQLNPHNSDTVLKNRVQQLAERMTQAGILEESQFLAMIKSSIDPGEFELDINAQHFVQWVASRNKDSSDEAPVITSTLDSELQGQGQAILDTRLTDLATKSVSAGALLVADHLTGDILVWVNSRSDKQKSGDWKIDAVLTPRQPGSALKPFVYALNIENGWTAATLIDDAPLSGAVGTGQHTYRNYSRLNYGPLRLRDCLGNSLNIPAVLAAKQLGPARLLDFLRDAGLSSLEKSAETYGLGLALGNGEVPLYELVEAYTALARGGIYHPLRTSLRDDVETGKRILSEETATVIGDILSDPSARELEFGRGSILNLPHQVAVKTGTSSDYRDAWAVGYDHRFVVGVWLGNLNNTSMNNVTGSTGPALVLRSMFAKLTQRVEPRALPISAKLSQKTICMESGRLAGSDCPSRPEWFNKKYIPSQCELAHTSLSETPETVIVQNSDEFRLDQPTDGLLMAKDPRIPDELEHFAFKLPSGLEPQRTEWLVDGDIVAVTGPGETEWFWPVEVGEHTAAVRIWESAADTYIVSAANTFLVKGRRVEQPLGLP